MCVSVINLALNRCVCVLFESVFNGDGFLTFKKNIIFFSRLNLS